MRKSKIPMFGIKSFVTCLHTPWHKPDVFESRTKSCRVQNTLVMIFLWVNLIVKIAHWCHDEAEMLHFAKTKLCRILHSFSMFYTDDIVKLCRLLHRSGMLAFLTQQDLCTILPAVVWSLLDLDDFSAYKMRRVKILVFTRSVFQIREIYKSVEKLKVS